MLLGSLTYIFKNKIAISDGYMSLYFWYMFKPSKISLMNRKKLTKIIFFGDKCWSCNGRVAPITNGPEFEILIFLFHITFLQGYYTYCLGRCQYNVTGWDRSHGLPALSHMGQHIKLSDTLSWGPSVNIA